MVNSKDEQTCRLEKQNEELQKLITWASENWDEWKMLCNPAITDTETRTQRRKWVESIKKLSKAGFPALILVFMTKCYYMDGESKQVVEGAIIKRLLNTWDENAIDEFISYLCKFDNWNARELPITEDIKLSRDEMDREEIDRLLNPLKKRYDMQYALKID